MVRFWGTLECVGVACIGIEELESSVQHADGGAAATIERQTLRRYIYLLYLLATIDMRNSNMALAPSCDSCDALKSFLQSHLLKEPFSVDSYVIFI